MIQNMIKSLATFLNGVFFINISVGYKIYTTQDHYNVYKRELDLRKGNGKIDGVK